MGSTPAIGPFVGCIFILIVAAATPIGSFVGTIEAASPCNDYSKLSFRVAQLRDLSPATMNVRRSAPSRHYLGDKIFPG